VSESRATTVDAETEDGVEARGASIEEAVSNALAQLGANREQVEVQVLSPESRALPGERLSTGERRVRVYRIDEHAANARALLEELLTRMEVPCRVSVRRGTGTIGAAGGGPVILDIAGDDLGLLILEPASADGLALAERLRRRLGELPIICTSIRPPSAVTETLRPAAYLVKPFRLAELEAALASALG